MNMHKSDGYLRRRRWLTCDIRIVGWCCCCWSNVISPSWSNRIRWVPSNNFPFNFTILKCMIICRRTEYGMLISCPNVYVFEFRKRISQRRKYAETTPTVDPPQFHSGIIVNGYVTHEGCWTAASIYAFVCIFKEIEMVVPTCDVRLLRGMGMQIVMVIVISSANKWHIILYKHTHTTTAVPLKDIFLFFF